MDVALSANGRRIIRVFFALVIVFLYAPIVILVIFSFNKGSVPTFPLSGFTLHWYHEFLKNGDMQAALRTSAIVAAISADQAASVRLNERAGFRQVALLPQVVRRRQAQLQGHRRQRPQDLAGDQVKVNIIRNGKRMDLTMKLQP